MFQFSTNSQNRLNTIKPSLQNVMRKALQRSFSQGLPDWGISSGNRTAEEQLKLFNQGRIDPGEIVTHKDGYNKKSNHQDGNAVDIYIWKDGKAWFDVDSIRPVAEVIKQVAKEENVCLSWGWDLWEWDAPHFQLC